MLKTDDIRKVWRYKLGVLYGFISTLAITPCLGFAYRAIPLTPDEFTAGLTLTTAAPQTLGIGISLVRSCGGNEGLALILTGAVAMHHAGAVAVGAVFAGASVWYRICLLTSAHPCTAAGTNILGIFTMPLWLKALFSGTGAPTPRPGPHTRVRRVHSCAAWLGSEHWCPPCPPIPCSLCPRY